MKLNYEQTKAKYLEVSERYQAQRIKANAHSERVRRNGAEVLEAETKVKNLENQLERDLGSGRERETLAALHVAQNEYQDALNIMRLADTKRIPTADSGEMSFTKLQEVFGEVSREFHMAIIHKELEALPPGFTEALLRAYSVFSGSDADLWGPFFAKHFPIEFPGHNKGEALRKLRREVLTSHGALCA